MRQTGGRKPDKKQFFKLFEAAWKQAASVSTAQSGFRESGTFPVNRNAIRPELFEPSKTSDRPLNSASPTSSQAPDEPSSASGSATASSESVAPNEPSSSSVSRTNGPEGKQ